MSGILGIINLDGQPVDRQLLRQMTDFMDYRGPDAQEIWLEGQAGLGHTMLRTTFEAEREQQPCSLDGRVWITADARIDGRADLIRKLAAQGCDHLKGIPDPELILHAYRVWGEDCLEHLLGDFAFAIWDGRRRRLFCARDHLGVKPFYYAQVGNCLLFSNTLNCLRLHPEVSDELNDLAIADFLLFELNQDPATTTFADIKRLPAAHSLTSEDGALRRRRFWSLPRDGQVLRYSRPRDYVEHFQNLLQETVADRLRTNRVGVLMSGGLDSTTLAALAKSLMEAHPGGYDLQAYTQVFNQLFADEERYYAGLVAAHLNLPIHYQAVDEPDLMEPCRLTAHWPEPVHGFLSDGYFLLLQQAAGRSRVLLNGDGGDEILKKSPAYFYRMLRGLRWGCLAVEVSQSVFIHGRLPQIGLRSSLKRWRHGEAQAQPFPTWLNPEFSARLDLPGRWEQFRQPPPGDHPLRPELQRILTSPLMRGFETADPGATGQPLEFRYPFLDLRLVNFAMALPPIPWCVDKLLLREVGRRLLPEAVCRREKTSLPADFAIRMARQPGFRWLDEFTSCPQLAEYVRRAAVPPVMGEVDRNQLWMNMRPATLNYWLQHHQSVHYSRNPDFVTKTTATTTTTL